MSYHKNHRKSPVYNNLRLGMGGGAQNVIP
jgi:hypothetical protein